MNFVWILSTFLLLVCGKCLPNALPNFNPKAEPVYMAEGNWDASKINNLIFEILAEEVIGVEVINVVTPENEMWPKISNGELSGMLEIWPGQPQETEYVFEERTIIGAGPLGVIGEIGWFTQTFVVDEHPNLAKIQSLTNPENAAIFNYTLYNGDPMWYIRDSEIIDHFNIPITVEYLGNEENLVDRIVTLTEQKIPMLFYFWKPHYLLEKLDLTKIQIPKVNGSDFYSEAILNKIMWEKLPKTSISISSLMDGFALTSDDQMTLLYNAYLTNYSHAACEWVKSNNFTWEYWIVPLPDNSVYLEWNSTGGIVALVLAVFSQVSLLIYLCAIIIQRKHPYIQAANYILLITIIIGALILVSSVYFLFGKATYASCSTAILLCGLGFSILWGSVLLKEFIIFKIFKKSKKMKKFSLRVSYPIVIYSALIGFELTIDLIWIFVAPPDTSNDFCGTGNGVWAISLYAFYKILLVFLGSVVAFSTRNYNSPYTESKYLGIGIYCFSILTILTILLMNFIPTREAIFTLIAGVSIAVFSLISPMFIVKLYKSFFTSHSEALKKLNTKVTRFVEKSTSNIESINM